MRVGSVYYHCDYFHHNTVPVFSANDLIGLDLLVFWGGGDINPQIYGEKNIASDMPNYKRDAMEVEVMREAIGRIPILGVCRGAQLACALLGGKLLQDVNNHGHSHPMVVAEPYRDIAGSPIVNTSSLHHQMMVLPEGCEVIASAPGQSTRRRISELDVEHGEHNDPEVAVHRDKKVLMVQGHPEYTPVTSDLTRFTVGLLNNLFGVAL